MTRTPGPTRPPRFQSNPESSTLITRTEPTVALVGRAHRARPPGRPLITPGAHAPDASASPLPPRCVSRRSAQRLLEKGVFNHGGGLVSRRATAGRGHDERDQHRHNRDTHQQQNASINNEHGLHQHHLNQRRQRPEPINPAVSSRANRSSLSETPSAPSAEVHCSTVRGPISGMTAGEVWRIELYCHSGPGRLTIMPQRTGLSTMDFRYTCGPSRVRSAGESRSRAVFAWCQYG
jgi:hypothetical protein